MVPGGRGWITARAPSIARAAILTMLALAARPGAVQAGGEIRLWPVPDLTKPPLHTLPHDELMTKLGALTNLQAVEDEASPTGYKLDIGPFPGWRDVPAW